jgi:hypothetical protein
MTFEDIRAVIRQARHLGQGAGLERLFEWSLRRALHGLTGSGALIALCDGGPGDPRRYFIHPFVIGMIGDTAEARELTEVLAAEVAAIVRQRTIL